ncbi:hypothetical protein CC1G_08398 [Coprinopsis cinerea okayama7|uniref:Uncharacterized protein n=1 Tax=Coprinopsis cinerea (strain Okayama-7 / 130 / ATCC MYA-4618 / FGSC 9003) TaxID=240176 RepID=A8NAM9_COPC7|nr:hypothetical protein CC1G_08398 [Coprinopsis cinerea okayama7\|eukprot:XP_001831881.2 hypothetical protein CC1G_08398 [Coprinopsis cinerea okayama7\
MPTATSQQPPSQTSLPSIRQLHPYLGPPSGMSQPLTTGGAGYDYPGGSTHYPPGPLPQLDGAGQPPPQREQPEIYGGVESEQDDFDQHGPPKKKRRRQALSCTGASPCLARNTCNRETQPLWLSNPFPYPLAPWIWSAINPCNPCPCDVITGCSSPHLQNASGGSRIDKNPGLQESTMRTLFSPRRTGKVPVAYRRTCVSLSLAKSILIGQIYLINPFFAPCLHPIPPIHPSNRTRKSNREKYVTRAEYDELKARFDQLWALVHRMLPPAPQTTVPYYQTMPPQPGPSVEAAQPYHYTPMLTPQQPYQPHLDGTPPVMQPLPPHRYPRPEDSHSPTRNAGPSSPLASTVQPLTQPPPSRSGRVGVVAGAGAGGVVGTAVVAGGGGGGGDPKSPGPSLYHVLLPQYRTVGVKKLLRADAHAGRASASRGPPGSRRLSNPPYYRSDPPRSAANPISSPSIPELYIDGTNPSLNPPQPFHHLPPQNSTGRRMSDASGRFPGLEDERSRGGSTSTFPSRDR